MAYSQSSWFGCSVVCSFAWSTCLKHCHITKTRMNKASQTASTFFVVFFSFHHYSFLLPPFIFLSVHFIAISQLNTFPCSKRPFFRWRGKPEKEIHRKRTYISYLCLLHLMYICKLHKHETIVSFVTNLSNLFATIHL